MFTDNDLRELIEYTSPAPVLSVYLNTEPSEGNADAYRLRLRTMLKGLNLSEDEAAIEQYFQLNYNWTGRGVAVFSCAGDGFFRAYPLAVPVRNWIHIGDRPSVKPLAGLLDSYGGYGVMLVDRQGARLFYFHLGELQEQDGVLGEAVKHTKQGGASTFPGRRGGVAGQTHYEDEIIDRNMKEIAEFAVHFFEEKHVRRIIIGGTDDNVTQLRSWLPKAWQSLVVGTFPMSMTANHTEVLNRALQVGFEAEQKRELRMVENVVTLAAKESGATVGLETTLSAINSSRVHTILIQEGFRKSGYRCQSCGMLTTLPVTECNICSGKIERIPDVVDLAVNTVMRSGGEVEVVHESPKLDQVGSVGAMLRY